MSAFENVLVTLSTRERSGVSVYFTATVSGRLGTAFTYKG